MKLKSILILLLVLGVWTPAVSSLIRLDEQTSLFLSPPTGIPGETLRFLLVSERPLQAVSLQLKSTGESVTLKGIRNGGGPPFWRSGEFSAIQSGMYSLQVYRGEELLTEESIRTRSQKSTHPPDNHIWEVTKDWNREMENLFSAWIERLFLMDDEGANWGALHEITRDPDRNILHNSLGLGEDEEVSGLVLRPDCADNPFFLRAYFAWKLGLPFGVFQWSRKDVADQYESMWLSNLSPNRYRQGPLSSFQSYLRVVMDSVHSGTAKLSGESGETELYSVPLTRNDLRPGVIYADPYGHTLMIVRWVPQTEDDSGKLLAVDAQPDGTIGIKRFWQGSFFFRENSPGSAPGFKAFRPVVLEDNRVRPQRIKEIGLDPDYGNFSDRQKMMDAETFYDSMEKVINPNPLSPIKAYEELHKAIHERLKARAIAVKNGEKHMKESGYPIIPMPDGFRIFQTTGPWEEYSTPMRDLKLLIAIDVLLDFPNKVRRNPDSFLWPNDVTIDEVINSLQEQHRMWADEIKISLTLSDNREIEISFSEMIRNIDALEMGYNPNDSIEFRWGIKMDPHTSGSSVRRAPESQRKRMEAYRHWFRNRTFPIR
ncbi:hypothetical protein ACFLT9_06260 [Acidobacteriota bacterium]